jgi:hypothetical protein
MSPLAVAATTDGVYVSDEAGEAIRKIDATSGDLVTTAGSGSAGFSGDRGPAVDAQLDYPFGVAIDSSGSEILADLKHHRIRVVAAESGNFFGQSMSGGDIYTVAGDGSPNFSGDGGAAIAAGLDPAGVAVDPSGNIVFADYFNSRVRVVAATSGTFYGESMLAGDVYTVAGGGSSGLGDGGPATAAELGDPEGVAVDGAGNLVIAALFDRRIRVVATTSGIFYGQAMTGGDIYTVAGDGIAGYSGDGGPATEAEFQFPWQVAVDSHGNLVIADGSDGNGGRNGNNRVRVVADVSGTYFGQPMTAGDLYTVAGTGTPGYSGDNGLGTRASLNLDEGGVAVDRSGNIVIADEGNHRVRIVASEAGSFYGVAMTTGDIYTVGGTGDREFSGDGGPATYAELSAHTQAAVDATGNLVIADSGNNRIRVVAAATGTYYRESMVAGDVYTVAGNGKRGFSGNGTAATAAELNDPSGLACDISGNILIADTGNNRIRIVATTSGTFYGQNMTAGNIYTLAGTGDPGASGDGGPAPSAELLNPSGVSIDASGNILIADTNNNRIRIVAAASGTFYGQSMTAGNIYTVAGTGGAGFSGDNGPATSAELLDPSGVSPDSSGNILIADTNNNRIRIVAAVSGTFYGQSMNAGNIYTLVGNGRVGFSGDRGPATKARVFAPSSVTVDPSGNLLIADTRNNRIRILAATSGTFYGQAMEAGDIYTILGDGLLGYAGDGAPATACELDHPNGVVVDRAGDVIVADSGNRRIRTAVEG